MHPVVLKSSQLILAGDIAGAEHALVAIADQHGDHALVEILDDLQPKDLLAVMREFDSSRESVVNMLVTPEQFARSIVLEKKYGDRTSERLRAMMNAVIHRDHNAVNEYLEAIAEIEGGSETLADYFEDRYDEMFSFATSGSFTPQLDPDSDAKTHNTWLMEKIEEIDHGLGFGNSIENSRPLLSRSEIADGDWMETAWMLRYELPDAFEEVMITLRDRAQKHVGGSRCVLVPAPSGSDGCCGRRRRVRNLRDGRMATAYLPRLRLSTIGRFSIRRCVTASSRKSFRPSGCKVIQEDFSKGIVQIANYFGTAHLRPELELALHRMVNLISLYLEDMSGGDLQIAAASLRDKTFLSHSKAGSDMLKRLHAMPDSTLIDRRPGFARGSARLSRRKDGCGHHLPWRIPV